MNAATKLEYMCECAREISAIAKKSKIYFTIYTLKMVKKKNEIKFLFVLKKSTEYIGIQLLK